MENALQRTSQLIADVRSHALPAVVDSLRLDVAYTP